MVRNSRKTFNDIGVVQEQRKLFFLELSGAKGGLGEDLEGIFCFVGRRISLIDFEFALGKLIFDDKGIEGVGAA